MGNRRRGNFELEKLKSNQRKNRKAITDKLDHLVSKYFDTVEFDP